ncbi:MAG TPA: tetratricopeptide repeat protein [Acidimicrobiales bacterium]|nr:tetratricopeptide repeat protein [Acidimicrobiales bacterium]
MTSAGTGAQEPDQDLADRLRRLRSKMGWSQEQLARRLEVSFATVNRWETGRTRISADGRRRLSALEASVARPAEAEAGHSSLPSPHSSFVGREGELPALVELLDEHRLVSLTGPGGVGKTRLALEAIRRAPTPERVTFVPLEPVVEAAFLDAAVASALGARDRAGQSTDEAIAAELAAGVSLLVLDGAEQLHEHVATRVERWLGSAPDLRIVVTSRRVLGVAGEACFVVPPLRVPPPGAGAAELATDAVQLFVKRARERSPGFTVGRDEADVVGELCRRLDGLPLAIELISGWVGTLSLGEIADRHNALLQLGTGSPDTRSGLEGVAAESFALLSPAAQQALPALSTFAGSFSLEDAQAVAGLDLAATASLLRELVDSSWLATRRGGGRSLFSMLETVRSHLARRLAASGEETAARRRHAEHCAELARQSEEGLAGTDSSDWAARMDGANPEFEAALFWAEEAGETELGLEISSRLWRWWLLCGRLTVGRGWLRTFLATAGQRRDERVGRALSAAAVLANENGDYADAVRQAKVAMGIFESGTRRDLIALAATILGSAHRYLSNSVEARRNFQIALDLRRATNDRRGVSISLNNLALIALDEEDLDEARSLMEQSLALKRQLGDPRAVAVGLVNLSDVFLRTKQVRAAALALDEAAGLARDLDNKLVGTIHSNLGDLAASSRDWASSSEHFRTAVAAYESGGHVHDVVNALVGLGRAEQNLGDEENAVKHLREAEALAADLGSAEGLATVRAALADFTSAAPVAAAGLTLRQTEVLRQVATGKTNKEIAADLHLSVATVERHLATVYARLGLRGRVEATRWAVAQGLVPRGQDGGGA